MKKKRMIEVNARGIVEVSEYGLMVDDADVLKTINNHFNKEGKGREDFAGFVSILVVDETDPMQIMDETELRKMEEELHEKMDGVIGDVLKNIFECKGECHDECDHNE